MADACRQKFFEFLNMYQDRMSSVSGIAQDTLFNGDDPEEFNEYLGAMQRRYLSGVDPVEAADADMKDWPPEQRRFAGTQTAEEFRKEWKEAQARFEAMRDA